MVHVSRLLGLCLLIGLSASPALAQYGNRYGGYGGYRGGSTYQGRNYPGPVRQLPYRPGNQNTNSGGFNWADQGSGTTYSGEYYTRPGLQNSNVGWNYNYNNGYNYGNSYSTGSYYQPAPAYNASYSGITINGAADSDLTFTLIAGGQSWERTVYAGSNYNCTDDREWYVQFHRGGDFETAQYRLGPGTYEFRGTDYGWELYKVSDF